MRTTVNNKKAKKKIRRPKKSQGMSLNLEGNFICKDSERGWIVFDPTNIRMFDAANPFFVATIKANDPASPNATYFTAESGQGWIRQSSTYNSFRALRVRLDITINSNEPATVVSFGVGFNDVLPVVTTYAQAQGVIARRPSYGPVLIGQTTGYSRFKVPPIWINNEKIVGNREYNYEQGYSGTLGTGGTSVSPTQFTYFTLVGLAFNAATNLTNGFFVSIAVSYYCEFYSRKQNI